MNQQEKNQYICLLFVLPAVIFFIIFNIYPVIRTFYLSFFKWDGVSIDKQFVGLKNFYFLLFHDKVWWKSLLNGAIFSFFGIFVIDAIGLLLAIIVYNKKYLRNFYTVVYYLPCVISGIVIGLIWKWIFHPEVNLINRIFELLSISSQNISWLDNPRLALFAIILASIWRGIGYPFLIFLAGLQNIPKEVCEAAVIDGVNNIQLYTLIIMPLLRPTIILVSILTVLGGFQTFDVVVAMTFGGPGYATEVPTLKIYKEALQFGELGYACAASLLLGLFLLILSLIQLKFQKTYSS